MNQVLAEKLREAMAEAERQGSPAAFIVLNLLMGNYHNGSHHQFANHCCQFTPLEGLQLTMGSPESVEDLLAGLDSPTYYH
jgi:hypothetical protein